MEAPTIGTDAIPLVCKICPKKPDFSDISHLVTHVGSKGHLSNYYKSQVLGAEDPEYQRLVAEYDDWYARYNVRDLMSQRLGQKAERKTRDESARRRQESGGTDSSTRHGPGPEQPTIDAQARSKDVDVKSTSSIKSEFLPQSPTTIGTYQNCGPHLYSLPFPYLQDWHTLPWTSDGFMNSPIVKYAASDNGGPGESPWISDGNSTLPLPPEPLCGTEDELALNETITDSSRMKGIFWQGMAMFDSATPEMKKKRNQKKGTAVLEQLQATSEDIRPSEMVFDTAWTHRRTRAITGSPANSNKEQSPLVGETTPEPDVPPKKRKSRQPRRKALAECDVNSGVVKRVQPKKRKSAPNVPVKNEPSGPTSIDDINGPMCKKRSSRKRRGFSIHRDNTGPEISFNESAPPSSLAMESGLLATARCSLPATDLHDSTLSLTPLYGSSHVENNDISSLMGSRPAGVFASAVSAVPNLSSFGQLNFGSQPLFQSVVFPANTPQQFMNSYSNSNYLPAPSSTAAQNHLPAQTTPLWLSFNHASHDSSSLYSSGKAGAHGHFNAASLRVPDRSSFGGPMASN